MIEPKPKIEGSCRGVFHQITSSPYLLITCEGELQCTGLCVLLIKAPISSTETQHIFDVFQYQSICNKDIFVMYLTNQPIWKPFKIQQIILGGDCGEPLSYVNVHASPAELAQDGDAFFMLSFSASLPLLLRLSS